MTEPPKLAGTLKSIRRDLGVDRRLRTRAVVQARCARALVDVAARCAGLHADVRVAFLADAGVLTRAKVHALGGLVAPVWDGGAQVPHTRVDWIAAGDTIVPPCALALELRQLVDTRGIVFARRAGALVNVGFTPVT